jgi:chromosome segregation ATPase
MLSGQLNRLNTEHGFTLPLPKSMSLRRLQQELDTIERGYIQHVSLTNFLKLQQASYLERLLRSVYSRLRTAFETASRDIDSWNKASVSGLESQLKERRRSFSRRVVAVDRIEEAITGLQERIDDAKVQETQLQGRLEELRSHVNALVAPASTLRTQENLDVELA